MEKPSLTGASAQKLISHMKSLTTIAFSDEMDEDSLDPPKTRSTNYTLSLKWNDMCSNMSNLWKMIEQRSDYTDKDLDKLHVMCNKFMTQWLDLLGLDHKTNYIHIVVSGHLTFFATKYRNLYRFSQQGWESLNQLLKHYYFNNTNHGGAAGNGGKGTNGLYSNGVISGDHCRSLMLLCQRSIMWKLGVANSYFKNMEGNMRNSLQDTKEGNDPKTYSEEPHEHGTFTTTAETITYGRL
jgi:hypothetical protein